MTNRQTEPARPDQPNNQVLMVSACSYYRIRADVERGMKKRDMPSADIAEIGEKEREKIADPEIVPSNP